MKDAASHWQDLFTAGTVSMALKTALLGGIVKDLKEKLEEVQVSEELLRKCHEAGWVTEGRQALDPAWVYHAWDPQAKKQIVAPLAPRSNSEMLKDLDLLLKYVAVEGVVHRFKCTKTLSDQLTGEVVPFMITISLRSPAAHEAHQILGRLSGKCVLQAAWHAAQTGAGKSLSDEQGHRAGLHEPGLLRVEASLEPVTGLGLGRPSPLRAVHQAARSVPTPGAALPLAKLCNPAGMNLCYANSCMQALFWLRELAGPALQIASSAQAGLAVLRRGHQVLLTDCLAFHELFRTWPDLTSQHDAGEFWQHLAVTLQLDALAGSWQARLTNPCSVVDQSPLHAPILLTPHTAGLQTMINNWRNQHAIHAVSGACQVACLQLCRYRADRAKNQEPIHIPPGLRVSLPHFCDPGMGTDVQSVDYRVGFVIFHVGATVQSGHYQAVLSVPDTHADPPTWTYHICDDRRPPRPANRRDLSLISRNSYLVGLLRS